MISLEIKTSKELNAMMQLTPNTAKDVIERAKQQALRDGVSGCQFIGKDPRFQGRTAIVRRDEKGILVAQFDHKVPGVVDETDLVCFGWHAVFQEDWDIKIRLEL